jgi:YHS domain-containing protein
MIKTHGMVASAWMLSSGLLLNVSLTAHAQENVAAPEEYFSPQRTTVAPTRKAPALLPSVIRNADTSKAGSVVRPIGPANDSLSAGRKLNTIVPIPSRSANRSAFVPTTHQQTTIALQSANEQDDAAPSPIQKQLEDLYRKDGRPMPQMNFNQTPIPANGQVPSAEGNARPNVIAPSNVVPPKPRSFLDKINPFSRHKTAPAALPQHPANPIPSPIARTPQRTNGAAPATSGINQAGGNQNPANRSRNGAPATALPVPPAVPVAQPKQPQSDSQLSDTLPPVPGDPGYQGSAADIGGEKIVVPPAPASVDDALENAFNEPSAEKAIDATEEAAAPMKQAKPVENDNPFSGLSLDDEFGPATKPTAKSVKPETAKPEMPADDEPMSDEKNIELPIEDEIPLPPAASQAEAAKAEIKEPAKEEVDNKIKLIAERGELRGLKGFCPVMLRDERDLKNALPEHHSTFKGRTYYFSSADAKAAFDEHPQQYAPISGGQDVVLLKEKVTKEGSLDHAVWFKDRLYLFTSQKTLEQFVATPKEFAISE